MNKHTPGPWKLDMVVSDGAFDDLEIKAQVGDKEVLVVKGCGCCGSPFGENEADARLIAAAPELAETLMELYTFLDVHLVSDLDPRMVRARAVLREAGLLDGGTDEV